MFGKKNNENKPKIKIKIKKPSGCFEKNVTLI